MHNNDAIEQAYRNGYEQGKRDAVKKCQFPGGITIKPDGEHELDPCFYETVEEHHGVTVRVLRCSRCGHQEIQWERGNPPLTKDELMQMVGQPVWTVGVSHTKDGTWSMWDIIEVADDDGIEFGYSTESAEWWAYNLRKDDGSLHRYAWVCYRHKPDTDE